MNATPDETRLIRSILCDTMPTAAIASGFVSAFDYGPWVAQMSERFPPADRPEVGVSGLIRWLAERGVTAGRAAAVALHTAWVADSMRHYSHKGG